MSPVTCISGIDTDIGKTVATGLMARTLLSQGHSVITQKIVQTGCSSIAEDIISHRRIMATELYPEDRNGLTCPYVFKKACSPHLAAELERKVIDCDRITKTTSVLAAKYDHVLLEGAGGLMVPLTRDIMFIDYLQEQGYPLILVTSPRLGSINHTLSALELIKEKGIEVRGLVYNSNAEYDEEIYHDSRCIFVEYMKKCGFSPVLVELESKENYPLRGEQFDCLSLFRV